ncbi:mechanosensitive ion channel family protein [Acidomonas methanolica]|uniref:mechanosensitive ion channel family protein n=1 Tax=Acidomonas methanolica TaxID=437 RepID=UPI00351DA398
MRQHFINALDMFRSWFGWLPPPVGSLLMLAVVGIVAFLASNFASDLILRIPDQGGTALIRKVVAALRRPVRLMIVIIAVFSALPAAYGLSYDTFYALQKTLIFLFILTLGVAAILAFRVATEAYLGRMMSREVDDDILMRAQQTQIRVLRRMMEILGGIITVSAALMSFETVRQYGVSLFASAGAASLIVGLSARGLLTNLIAGVQIAITQPIRMEDLIIINGDWAWVEEITATYVVLRVWDWRRHIVPISYFLENQFENWTHNSAALIGVVFLTLDYQAPMDRIRAYLKEIIATCPLWDGKVFDVQMADSDAHGIRVRIIASARTALQSWDLRCDIREKIITRLREECPEALPRGRIAMVPPAPGEAAWPGDEAISPPVARPPPGSYLGPRPV